MDCGKANSPSAYPCLWLSGGSSVRHQTLPSTYTNAATGFIEILQWLKEGSITQCPGATWLKWFSCSTKLVSAMWKLPIGKNKEWGTHPEPAGWPCSSCWYSPSEFGFLRKADHRCIGGDLQSGMRCVTQQAKPSSWYHSKQRYTSFARLAMLTRAES